VWSEENIFGDEQKPGVASRASAFFEGVNCSPFFYSSTTYDMFFPRPYAIIRQERSKPLALP